MLLSESKSDICSLISLRSAQEGGFYCEGFLSWAGVLLLKLNWASYKTKAQA